jgi:hypothetical protein
MFELLVIALTLIAAREWLGLKGDLVSAALMLIVFKLNEIQRGDG